MGRNKNKYLKDKSNQPGFCYTKCSNSNVKNSLDNIMDEFGFQKDIVYSENKDKRWALKEELVTKVAGSENADSEAIIYELDSFKPSDAKCIAKSTKKPKDELMVKKTNKNRDCQKCQEKANKEVKDEKRKKSTSMIVFNKEVYKKKGVNCGCCNELDAKQRKKFKNEKIKALSECAYDPYDEEEDFDNAEEQEIKSFLTAEQTLRPMSIDIESILNDSNENLRFKPRDPDNGFEVINSKLLLEEENSSSDFEYIADDELKP